MILADILGGEDEALRTVARAAAEYIDSILTKDSIIGIGRGRTLQTVVECMEPQRFLPIQVVQLIGLLNNPSQNEEEMELGPAVCQGIRSLLSQSLCPLYSG